MSKLTKISEVELTEEECERIAGEDLEVVRCRVAARKFLGEQAENFEVIRVDPERADKRIVALYVGQLDVPIERAYLFVEPQPQSRRFSLLGYTNAVTLDQPFRGEKKADSKGRLHYEIAVDRLNPVEILDPSYAANVKEKIDQRLCLLCQQERRWPGSKYCARHLRIEDE